VQHAHEHWQLQQQHAFQSQEAQSRLREDAQPSQQPAAAGALQQQAAAQVRGRGPAEVAVWGGRVAWLGGWAAAS
jgi:hypothetical protein